jgi:hypothetical protein
VTVTLAADAIGLIRSFIKDGASPTIWALVSMVTGMALITLAAGWILFHLLQGLAAPHASHSWGWAVVVSVMFLLILAFYPLRWRGASITGAIFTALTGMMLLFITVWGFAIAIIPVVKSTNKDIFAELSIIFQGWKKKPGRLAIPFLWVDKVYAQTRVQHLLEWFNPSRHRWNLVLLLAVAMGLMLGLVESLAEGVPSNLNRVMLVAGIYVSLETAGVVLGYLLFGKYLGIFLTE